jgi:hypothetical protein
LEFLNQTIDKGGGSNDYGNIAYSIDKQKTEGVFLELLKHSYLIEQPNVVAGKVLLSYPSVLKRIMAIRIGEASYTKEGIDEIIDYR